MKATITAADLVRPPIAPSEINCEQCAGRGYIAQWVQGKPQFKHMGRCEQCSGFGRVK